MNHSDEDLLRLISQATAADDDEFYEDRTIVSSHGGIDIVERCGRRGISEASSTDDVVLPTIFSDIRLLPAHNIACCRFPLPEADGTADRWGLYDYEAETWLLLPRYTDYDLNEEYRTIDVIDGEGHHGLYSLRLRRLVIPALYDDTTQWDRGEYLWVKLAGSYHFVHRDSGQHISVPEATMAFDTAEGMLVVYRGRATALNSEGYGDRRRLRQLVVQAGGRYTAFCQKYHRSITFDVYGYVFE